MQQMPVLALHMVYGSWGGGAGGSRVAGEGRGGGGAWPGHVLHTACCVVGQGHVLHVAPLPNQPWTWYLTCGASLQA